MSLDYGIEPISLDGFQVVKGKYFGKQSEPMMTLFKSAVSFNVAAFEALNRCDTVVFYVNEAKKSILIKPSASKEQDAVHWVRGKEKIRVGRVECTSFAKQIFDFWKLNPDFRYRTTGKLVQADKKIMLLFDFNECESWNGSKLVK